MPIVDADTGRTVRDFTIDELVERARYMRGLNELALCAAGSGHSGGTLGFMDVAAALYLKVARHDPKRPDWPDRDRIVWSAGHKAPALYTALAVTGFFDESDLYRLRMLGGPYQGHPHWRDCPGVEISAGSLGQGFSVAVGMALAAKLDGRDHRIFAICTDGEQQEGSIWEAAMAAAHHHLDNLIAVIDKNDLQIDGWVPEVMTIDPLIDKYRAFNWHVISVDGHSMPDLVTGLEQARSNNTGQPVAVICHTHKGRGVSFMEDVVGWHGKPPDRRQLDSVLHELDLTGSFDVDRFIARRRTAEADIETDLDAALPRFSRDYWWNRADNMRVEMAPTRKGFGQALAACGDDNRIVCIGADISESITIADFHRDHPGRAPRFISVGIAEQNATTIAAGLAREGKLPVFGTYGVFASARNLDQLRISVCYADLNVLIAGAHGGISVGPDGATHQELEALFQICGLPNMHVAVPCDIIETRRMTETLLFDVVGPGYLRFAREATPVITRDDTPLHFGEANIYRYRGEADRFLDAFEIRRSSDYRSEGEDLTIISCGPELAEACRAAYILMSEFGLQSRVINLHTVKPLDTDAIVRAAEETGAIIVAEEHQVGGLGNRVAAPLMTEPSLRGKLPPFAMIGVNDTFGESGRPWQLIRKYGLAAEHIAHKAKSLLA